MIIAPSSTKLRLPTTYGLLCPHLVAAVEDVAEVVVVATTAEDVAGEVAIAMAISTITTIATT